MGQPPLERVGTPYHRELSTLSPSFADAAEMAQLLRIEYTQRQHGHDNVDRKSRENVEHHRRESVAASKPQCGAEGREVVVGKIVGGSCCFNFFPKWGQHEVS